MLFRSGRRLAFCSETDRGRRFAAGTMKRLVGGDPIRANRMRQDPIQFLPTHTLIMLTNHLPAVDGDDPAIWRRIMVVPFDVVIPPHEQDPRLPQRLREPAVRAAVLAWAWRGYLDYQQAGLAPPEAVQGATSRYQTDSDVVGRFLAEEVEFGPARQVTSASLYTRFVAWARGNGEDPMSKTALGKAMRDRDYASTKATNAQMVYKGLGLVLRDEDTADRWR